VRRPTGSSAQLSSATVRNPTFTPDVAGVFGFRLDASDAAGTSSTTTVLLTARICTPPGATLTGANRICLGTSAALTVALTGTAPWTIHWSDGFVQTATQSPATHSIVPTNAGPHTYGVDSVSDATGCSGAGSQLSVYVVARPPTPTLTAPTSAVAQGQTGLTASVLQHAGSTYQWSADNGTITAGQGTNQITFTAGTAGRVRLSVQEKLSGGTCLSDTAIADVPVLSGQTLLLLNKRVKVEVKWSSPYSSDAGTANAIVQDDKFGFFYFYTPDNPEVFVKALDFGATLPIFFAALSDYHVEVTFTVVATGQSKTFVNEAKTIGGDYDSTTLKPSIARGETIELTPLAADPTSIDLSQKRVRVSIAYTNPYTGESGTAFAIPEGDEYAFFYFSDKSNPEVFVKVLGFGDSPEFAVLCGGLTDFEYHITFQVLRAGGQTVVFDRPAKQKFGGAFKLPK
jgi:hypothetical protein